MTKFLARNHGGNVAESEMELGLLRHSSADTTQEEGAADSVLQTPTPSTVEPRNNLNQVIGEALEVFSRHLRTEN
jgi:hypothetical protein